MTDFSNEKIESFMDLKIEESKSSKIKKLILGIVLDGIGVVTSTWVIPFFGEFADVAWAPLAGWLMLKLYKGNTGKIAGVITFIEELFPALDVIPTFTLTWLYVYLIKR